MEELKPCPFCKSKAEYTTSHEFVFVKCTNNFCRCMGPRVIISDSYAAKDIAIKKWNERISEQDK